MRKRHYPFVGIVGQEELLLGLILNVINPKLGGILIKGVKGSSKSTAVYALPQIIPKIKVNEACNFNCDPNIEELWCEECLKKEGKIRIVEKNVANVQVPLSITEERLLGNINVEKLLKKGETDFIPGILAKAHRQILYIDEVNLLPDHIIDDILDVSAMKWNTIERENFSISHPSDFLLIGTMNPEEGELRPQILDRFPISVEVKSVGDINLRKEIIKRNLLFERDPMNFIKEFASETENLKKIIKISRKKLNKVQTKPYFYDQVVNLCADKKIDGHRADITIIKTAETHAAFELKKQVSLKHIKQAAKFVLRHRTREGGLLKPLTAPEIDEYFAEISEQENQTGTQPLTNEIDKDINLFSHGGLIKPEKK